MSGPAFTIVGLTIRDVRLGNGMRLIATFDCAIGPVQLLSCTLKLTANGRHLMMSPTQDTSRAKRGPAALITDPALRAAIADGALAAYTALRGAPPETPQICGVSRDEEAAAEGDAAGLARTLRGSASGNGGDHD